MYASTGISSKNLAVHTKSIFFSPKIFDACDIFDDYKVYTLKFHDLFGDAKNVVF